MTTSKMTLGDKRPPLGMLGKVILCVAVAVTASLASDARGNRRNQGREKSDSLETPPTAAG